MKNKEVQKWRLENEKQENAYVKVSTENATSPKCTDSRNSDFAVSRGPNSNRDFGLI